MTRKIPKGYVLGTRLAYNRGSQLAYEKALRELVAKMARQTQCEVTEFFNSPTAIEYFGAMDESISTGAEKLMAKLSKKFIDLFTEKAPLLSKNMVNDADKVSKRQLINTAKKITGQATLSKNFIPPATKQITKSVIAENVTLITSIPEQYFKNVTGAVMRSISTGGGVDSLLKYIKKNYDMTDARAKNLALDQTRKAYNSINKQRMEDIGYKKYMWAHSGGGLQPRKLHQEMDGKIYRLDKPPIIDKKTGERGIPGQAINCGCTMIPVYEFGEKA